MKLFAFFFGIILLARGNPIKDDDCHISTDYMTGDLTDPQPLVLSHTPDPILLYPDENQIINISRNTSILLACPGQDNSLKFFEKPSIIARCLGGKQFLVDTDIYQFSDFECKVLALESVKKIDIPCLNDSQRYDIGFAVGNNKFITTMETCRDEKTLRTFYSKNRIVGGIQHKRQENVTRIFWKFESLYPKYVDTMYTRREQIHSLEIQLNSKELANEYISKGQEFLTRGHYAAKADFVYAAEQRSTFWLLNAAPQWKTFNSGNWMLLEQDVRDLTTRRNIDLIVYTGVHGQTTLPDVNGNDVSIYAHVDGNDREIPIPRFYWKVILDPVSKRGVAFVGLNEPYAKSISDDMYLCPDISDDPAFSWLTWNPKDIEAGVSYVCTIDELRKAVPTVPDVKESGILK